MKFKVGMKIRIKKKFTDKFNHSDWDRHKEEWGIITKFNDENGKYSIRIRWKDGEGSTAEEMHLEAEEETQLRLE